MNTSRNNLLKSKWANVNTTFALQVFNIQRFVATFLSGVVLVKFGWSEADIDSYEYLLLLFGVVTFFWISGTQNALLSLLPKTLSADKDAFLNKALTTVLIFGAFASVCLLIFGPLSFPSLDKTLITWLALYTFLNIPSLFIHIKFLLAKRPQAILVFGSVNFFLQFAFIAIPVFFGSDLLLIIKAMTVLAGLRFIYFLFLSGIDLNFNPSYRIWLKRWILLSIPLSLHILIGVSPEYVDAFLVEYFIKEDGYYAIYKYGARELPLVISLITAVGTASLPVLVEDEATGLDLIKSKTKRLSHFLFPISIVLMFASSFLYKTVYNSSFSDSAIVFNIYLLIILTRMFMPQVIITAKQNNYFLLLCGGIEFIVNVGLSIALVSSLGLFGIAIGSVMGNLVQKFLMVIYVRSNYGIPPSKYVPLKLILFYSTALLVSFWLSGTFVWI
jgi:O-antigen/teichoic acid export membrane protein